MRMLGHLMAKNCIRIYRLLGFKRPKPYVAVDAIDIIQVRKT